MDNRYIETSLGDQILNRKLTSYRETTVLKQYYLILSLLKSTFFITTCRNWCWKQNCVYLF